MNLKLQCFASILMVLLVLTLFFEPAEAIDISRTYDSMNEDKVLYRWGSTYPSVVDGSNAFTEYRTQTTGYIGQDYTAPSTYAVWRMCLFFDTSALPDDTNITSAKIGLCVETDVSARDFEIVVQNSTTAETPDFIDTFDYDKTLYTGRNGGNMTTVGGLSSDTYYNITLNDEGVSYIMNNALTRLMIRSSRDINETQPTSTNEYISIYMSEAGEDYSPKLYLEYETLSSYQYRLYGPFNEGNGTLAGDMNVTFFRPTQENLHFELNTSTTPYYCTSERDTRQVFIFDWGDENASRTYYVYDTYEDIYSFKPVDPYFVYYFTIADYVGLSGGYLETFITVNGTDRVVERWSLETLHEIPFTLSWGAEYKIRLISDQGIYLFGSIIAGADRNIELSVTSIEFPTDYSSFGLNISVSATRESATWIQFLYEDNSLDTAWVYVNIQTRNGVSAYTYNSTDDSITLNWYEAKNITHYVLTATIQHNTFGTLYYSRMLNSPAVFDSPFDLSFLGSFPIDPTQLFAMFITILFGGLASTRNVVVGGFVTVIVASIFVGLGWLNISVTLLTVCMLLVFMLAFSLYRRRFYG